MLWKKSPSQPIEIVEELSKKIGVNKSIAELLVARGIYDFESAKYFFRPEWSHLHDPFLMKDMKEAVTRIQKAIDTGEGVMIFGDYDVDGTTSVALLTSYLNDKIPKLRAYIPDRYNEGYGISKKGIQEAQADGISLIIALDCGVKAIEQINYANSLEIDFIICDHHLPGPQIPNALAVLDPKRKDCNYPFKELCGCGVGFKLVQALQKHFKSSELELLIYLDLVAIAIAADIVPITGENRTLTFLGLKQLQNSPRLGLHLFIKDIKRPLVVRDLVYIIAPRINASGRMDQGINSVELLMSKDQNKILSIARSIEFFNTERKSTEERIVEEALQQIELEEEIENSSTVVYHHSWHKGVIGIVASRLIEKFYRPTVVITKSGDILAGSARSVSGFDIYSALKSCEDSMIKFGGHKYAAGLTLKPEKLNNFKKAFEDYVKENILPEQKSPFLNYDLELELNNLNPKFFRILNQMEPFGPQNSQPVFVTCNCRDAGGSRIVGNNKNHLKLDIIDEKGIRFKGIGFGMGYYLKKIKMQKTFSLLYTLDENHYNGEVSLQLNVKDLKFN